MEECIYLNKESETEIYFDSDYDLINSSDEKTSKKGSSNEKASDEETDKRTNVHRRRHYTREPQALDQDEPCLAFQL